MKPSAEWYAIVRDAALIATGVIIAFRLTWTANGDPALISLALALVGTGAYGRGQANGKGKNGG